MKRLLLFLLLLPVFSTIGQTAWKPDILGDGFEQRTIVQPDDYEGKVTCTVIRKRTPEKSRKAVLYVHGFNDYFFQAEMANWYLEQGYAFYAVDLRKYGRSILPNQKMNNIRDLKEYFADIDTALHIIQADGANNVLLSGHSTGGLITTYYVQEHPYSPLYQGLFLNSPFFDFNESWLLKKLGIPLVSKKGLKQPDKLKKGGFSKWYGYSLHKSEHGEWDYNLTWKPHVAPSVNYGWIRAIHEAQKAVKSGKPVTVPVLVICSLKSIHPKKWSDALFTGDAILDVKDIYEGYQSLNTNRKTITQLRGLVHDVVLSPKPAREQVYKSLGEWMAINMIVDETN